MVTSEPSLIHVSEGTGDFLQDATTLINVLLTLLEWFLTVPLVW